MHFDLIIVGVGLSGASLGVALRHSRLSIALVDGRPPRFTDDWDTRLYALSPQSQQFLDTLGTWQHLDATRVCPVYDMDIRAAGGGRVRLSAYEAGVPKLAWIVEQSLLQRELWETVKRQGNITLLCPASPSALSVGPDAVRLDLADGRQVSASLIVGADGADSWVRQHVGLDAHITPYGKQGVVANFRTEKPHRNTAFQWFRERDVLAYLPLPGNQMSMVWSCPDAQAAQLLALTPDALADTVAAAGEHQLGALACVSAAHAFALRLIRVPRVVAPRVALIGDAAHAIHPLAGHGANLGFQDAATLARQLTAAPAWQDPGELGLLRGYARARAESVSLMQTGTHVLDRLFGANQAMLRTAMNAGMSLIDRAPFLRNALVRLALNL